MHLRSREYGLRGVGKWLRRGRGFAVRELCGHRSAACSATGCAGSRRSSRAAGSASAAAVAGGGPRPGAFAGCRPAAAADWESAGWSAGDDFARHRRALYAARERVRGSAECIGVRSGGAQRADAGQGCVPRLRGRRSADDCELPARGPAGFAGHSDRQLRLDVRQAGRGG